jgi:sarcosine oxidase subunit beta
MMSVAMKRRAERLGATFRFQENVTGIEVAQGRVQSVTTDKGKYLTERVINCSGADAREIGKLTELDLPVFPDCHEAGISAPVQPFLDPLVVDLRPGPGGHSANFYFGQNAHGQIIFCYTPEPAIVGMDCDATSEFLPHVAQRLIDLIPRFKDLVIRRTWRGLYPMTPDGLPIMDTIREIQGMYVAVGMCGQGFMMGPGVGLNMAAVVAEGKPVMPSELWKEFTLYGDFTGKKEALK